MTQKTAPKAKTHDLFVTRLYRADRIVPQKLTNAIEALGSLESEQGFVYLMPHLRDPDNRCRANAVLALVRTFGFAEDLVAGMTADEAIAALARAHEARARAGD